MKRTFRLENLDCALCAEKLAAALRRIDGVESAEVSFLWQRLTLEASEDRFDSIMKEAKRVCKKVEPDCVLLP